METSPKIPEFGKDVAPTDEMIAQGRFGNGAYGTDDSTLALVRAERKRIAIQNKEDRRAAYEAKVVEDLENIADLQSGLIKLAKKKVNKAIAEDTALDKNDMEVIKEAQKAAVQVSNRVLGLASRLDDKATTTDGLSFMIEGTEVSGE